MIDHSHNVQICAGCVAGDLQLALSLIRAHNSSLLQTPATVVVERVMNDIVEAIKNATFPLGTEDWTTEEVGLGPTDSRPDPQ